MNFLKVFSTLIILPSLLSAQSLNSKEGAEIVESIKPEVTVIKRQDVGDIYIVRSEWREAGPFYPYSDLDIDKSLEARDELKSLDHTFWSRHPYISVPVKGEIVRLIVLNPKGDTIDYGIFNISSRLGGTKNFQSEANPRPNAITSLIAAGDNRLIENGYSILDTETRYASMGDSNYNSTDLRIDSFKKALSKNGGSLTIDATYPIGNFFGSFLSTTKENLESVSYQEFLNRVNFKDLLNNWFLKTGMGLTEYENQTKTLSLTKGITKIWQPSSKRCAEVECDTFGFPIAPKAEEVGDEAVKSAKANVEKANVEAPKETDKRANENLQKAD